MTDSDDDRYLADLADFVRSAARVVARGEAAFFDADDDIVRRAGRSIVVDIAAAAGRLSAQLRERHPDIEWHAIIGMRNRVAHSYWSINDRIIWNALRKDVPDLAGRLGLDDQG